MQICFETFQELFFCSYFFSFAYGTNQQSFVFPSLISSCFALFVQKKFHYQFVRNIEKFVRKFFSPKFSRRNFWCLIYVFLSSYQLHIASYICDSTLKVYSNAETILNLSWKQHPTKHQLCGSILTIASVEYALQCNAREQSKNLSVTFCRNAVWLPTNLPTLMQEWRQYIRYLRLTLFDHLVDIKKKHGLETYLWWSHTLPYLIFKVILSSVSLCCSIRFTTLPIFPTSFPSLKVPRMTTHFSYHF